MTQGNSVSPQPLSTRKRAALLVATASFAFLTGLAFQACSSKASSTGKACEKNADCDVGFVCKDEVCTQAVTCQTLQCAADEVCLTTKTDSSCVKPGCRANADCAANQFCVDSVCGAAPSTAVDSCEIVNGTFTFAPGAVVKVDVIAYDAAGKTIPYKRATNLASNNAAFTADAAAMTLTASGTGGTAEVTATVGTTTCTTANFTNVGVLASDKYRVILVENGTGAPITGLGASRLKIYFSSLGGVVDPTPLVFEESPAGSGAYLVTAAVDATRAVLNVVVLDATTTEVAYSPTSVVGVNDAATRDFTLALNKFKSATGFGGAPNFTEYDAKVAEAGLPVATKVQVAASLGSLPLSALLSLDLNLILGDLANKQLSELICNIPDISAVSRLLLSSECPATLPACSVVPDNASSTDSVPLPRWLYGRGSTEIGPNCGTFASRVSPGSRLAWSLGIKVEPSALVNAALPLVEGAGITSDFSKIAAAVGKSGLFDSMAISADNFAKGKGKFTAGQESVWKTFAAGGAGTFENLDPKSFRLFRRKPTNFASTGVVADPLGGIGGKMNATALLVVSAVPGFGIVPLGLGIGVDNDNNGKFDLLNPDDVEMAEDTIYARYANPPPAISDSDVFAIALTANFADIAAPNIAASFASGKTSCSSNVDCEANAECSSNKCTKVDPRQKSALAIRGLVQRNSEAANRLGWSATDKNPSIGRFDNASKNVKFVGFTAESGAFGTADGATPVKYTSSSANVLNSPSIKWDMAGAAADLVVIRVSGDNTYWNVIVDPDRSGEFGKINLASPPGVNMSVVLPGALDVAKTVGFTSVALKFKNGTAAKKVNAFAATSGKDFDQLMNDAESFAVFAETSVGFQAR